MGIFFSESGKITEGTLAPDFDLPDHQGKRRRLADYRGSWLILYFYPRDDTPGCTREACGFRDDFAALRALGVAVLGVSLDDRDSHREFVRKHGLPFPLLSDTGGELARRYGSLRSLGFVRFARRHTFIIDPEGAVARVFRNVRPSRHSQEVIAVVTELVGLDSKDD